MSIFHIEEVMVYDNAIWPIQQGKNLVKRYALVDEKGGVWANGHPFGVLDNMTRHDRSSRDCRYLLRKTEAEAWADALWEAVQS